MLRKLKNLFKDERGQDMIEYALLASLIAVAVLALVSFADLADAIADTFQAVIDAL